MPNSLRWNYKDKINSKILMLNKDFTLKTYFSATSISTPNNKKKIESIMLNGEKCKKSSNKNNFKNRKIQIMKIKSNNENKITFTIILRL